MSECNKATPGKFQLSFKIFSSSVQEKEISQMKFRICGTEFTNNKFDLSFSSRQPCVGVKDSTLVENLETSCRSYYICESDKPIERSCPDGMLFNIKTEACDWPQNVRCGALLKHAKKEKVELPVGITLELGQECP